jgi:hypothetical protein
MVLEKSIIRMSAFWFQHSIQQLDQGFSFVHWRLTAASTADHGEAASLP